MLLGLGIFNVSAQTLSQAKELYEKGDYAKAKPVFLKYVKSQPANGNYNLWYGVCCLKTGEADKAVKYLETAVKKGFLADNSICHKHITMFTVLKMPLLAMRNTLKH